MKYLVAFCCIQFSYLIQAQESILFGNDQYSGISSVMISPAQAFLNPNPWDINMIAEDVFVQNDYGFISQQSFIGLTNAEIKSASIKKNITGDNTPNVFDFYNNEFGNYHLSSDILGPSFQLKINIKEKDFAVGLFSRLRTQSSAVNVDNYLRFGNQDLLEPELYTLKPLKINFMNWAEIGLNVATEIFPYSDHQWIIGGNIKYEIGLDALNVESKVPFQLTRSNDEADVKSIVASDYDIAASFVTNYNFETDRYEYQQRGKGLGFDFGLTFIDRDSDAEDYNLKAGLNVLDIGSVSFEGENHLLKGSAVELENNPTFKNTKFKSPHQFLQLLSNEVYGDENASLQGTDFKIGLPTSLHFNISKNIREHHYLNADWIQRIPVFENSLKRSNIFNVSYTVQKPVVGYGGSISLYEYRSLQVGAYLRIGPLILGSENLFPLIFKQKRLHSGDFYIAIKLYPFWDNEMKRHRRENCNC